MLNQLAPDFEAKMENGNSVKLSDYNGKKLLLYFYPRDNTPGCTKQACSLRDKMSDLSNANISVLGVSKNSAKSHLNFIEKYQLNFPLIVDAELELHKKYHAKDFLRTKRIAYLIDESGKIIKIFDKIKVNSFAQDVLNSIHE